MNNARSRTRHLASAVSMGAYACLLLAQPSALRATEPGIAAATHEGDVAAVRAQLKSGADANARDRGGNPALLWAAYNSSPELVGLLLKAGADPDAANPFGVTPLLQAARAGDAATVRALLEGGADMGRAVREGETPLMAAARAGSVEAVKLMLERGADVNAAESLQSETALMWATAEGHVAVVDALLAAGADPNRQARISELTKRSPRTDFPTGGFTALMWAARNGNDDLVQRLLAGKADVNAKNGDGATAMMLAIVNGRFDMAAMLLAAGGDANDGSLYQTVVMRDAPTDWRARDGSRLRPSHPNKLTALDLVAKLLDAGADPNKPFAGQMHSASMCCDTQAAGTPFFRAAVAADVETLKLMVAHGANLEWTLPRPEGMPAMPFGDNSGLTPLMAAVNGGKGLLMDGGPGDIRENVIGVFREPGNRNPGDAVRVLLSAGANPNAKNPHGDTALHIAAHDGKLEPMRALVEGGADVNVRNAKGQTALQVVETMAPRKLNDIAAMIGLFDDGAQPKETAVALRQLIAARQPSAKN